MKTLFENEIALVLIVKNESPYIEEWLEYHYRIGVDKFYIYNNDSEDRAELLKILDPWIKSGVVDFEDAPGKFKQIPIYSDAIERHRFDCRYMGFIDTDEFIYIKTGQSLPDFIDEYFTNDNHTAGLGINWRMFGSSGKKFYAPIDVIERFTHRAADNYRDHRVIKTILNPRRALQFTSAHSAEYLLSSACNNERYNPVVIFYNYENTTQKIQINHYYTKSIEEYSQKYSRGRADCADGRDKNAALNSELNALEDVELRDFWRQLKRTHLPKPKDRSQKKILDNIRTMISYLSDRNSIEMALTCLDLISKSSLLRPTDKNSLENFLLNKLKTTLLESEVTPWDWNLILLMTPKFLSINSKESIEILQIIRRTLPQLITIAETENRYSMRLCIKQFESIMNAIY